jgi:hypothetical protein
MRYSLRTLLVCLILMPPLAAGVWRATAQRQEDERWVDVEGPGAMCGFELDIGCAFDPIPENRSAETGEPASLETADRTEEP